MSVSLPATPAPQLPARTWRPSLLISASVAVHVAAAGLAVLRPQAWPWALGAVAGDHLALTAAGLIPRSHLLGPNATRLPAIASARAVAITIDDGPDPQVTPRVLDILDAHAARATFFCLGEGVMRHASLAREILARGHDIGNHSYRHLKRFSFLGPAGVSDEVMRAQQAIRATTGYQAKFFRAPAGLRNVFLEPVLARHSLRLISWTRRGFDTVNGDAMQVLNRLTKGLRGGDILLLHDAHAARSAAGTAVIVEVLPRLLAALAQADLATVTLAHAFAAAGEA
jgi:peptidoglycan/xylan/chitin deacetylase (PgdA/CDA1 family)